MTDHRTPCHECASAGLTTCDHPYTVAEQHGRAGNILAEALPRPVGFEDVDRNLVDLAQQAVDTIAWQRKAVMEHHGQKADDRCWQDDDVLYAAFGLPPADHHVGDQDAMLANCRRFITSRTLPGEWQSYASLADDVERMTGLCQEAANTIEQMAEERRVIQYDVTAWSERAQKAEAWREAKRKVIHALYRKLYWRNQEVNRMKDLIAQITHYGWSTRTRNLEAEVIAYRTEYLKLKVYINDLRTEPGRAMFAIMNNWPLPEERLAWMGRVEELERELAQIHGKLTGLANAENLELRQRVDDLESRPATDWESKYTNLLDDLSKKEEDTARYRKENVELEQTLNAIFMNEALPNGWYPHVTFCNGNRLKPVGLPGCSCPVGAPRKKLERLEEQVRAAVIAATGMTPPADADPAELLAGLAVRARLIAEGT